MIINKYYLNKQIRFDGDFDYNVLCKIPRLDFVFFFSFRFVGLWCSKCIEWDYFETLGIGLEVEPFVWSSLSMIWANYCFNSAVNRVFKRRHCCRHSFFFIAAIISCKLELNRAGGWFLWKTPYRLRYEYMLKYQYVPGPVNYKSRPPAWEHVYRSPNRRLQEW